MSNELDEIIGRLQGEPERKEELNTIAKARTPGMVWFPNPGAQTDAYFCEADELFYGGEAGGGKTDLLLGVALNMHRRALILRRLNGEVDGLLDRMQELVGVKGLKRNPPASYRTMHKIINFGGCQHLDDRLKYQGRPPHQARGRGCP